MSFMPTVSPRSGTGAEPSRILAGMRARGVEIEMGERADFLLARRDRRRAEIDDRFGREFTGLDAAREIERGELLAGGTIEHCVSLCDG